MASQTAICNMALTQVGFETLTAVDSSTKQGRIMLALWTPMLEALLAEHAWSFATLRVDLEQSSETPVYEFTYAYKVPSDCLRILSVDPDTEYSLEYDGLILSDEAALSLKYMRRVTESGRFPPWFTVALADLIAARAALALSGDAGTRKYLEEYAWNVSIPKAIAADTREAWGDPGDETDNDSDSWLTTRGTVASDTDTLVIDES